MAVVKSGSKFHDLLGVILYNYLIVLLKCSNVGHAYQDGMVNATSNVWL